MRLNDTSIRSHQLAAKVGVAFANASPPPMGHMLQAPYASNDDGFELQAAFAGRRWEDLTIDEIFYHRESLFMLGREAFRAYLPAYLVGALTEDERTAPDVGFYMLACLRPRPPDVEHVGETTERLSALEPAQRAVIGEVVRYLAELGDREAAEVLETWR